MDITFNVSRTYSDDIPETQEAGYGVNQKDIRVMAQEFLSMPGVEFISEINTKTLFNFWPERVRDYGDAIIAATCRHIRGSAVLTFDGKFKASLKGLGLKIYQPYKM